MSEEKKKPQKKKSTKKTSTGKKTKKTQAKKKTSKKPAARASSKKPIKSITESEKDAAIKTQEQKSRKMANKVKADQKKASQSTKMPKKSAKSSPPNESASQKAIIKEHPVTETHLTEDLDQVDKKEIDVQAEQIEQLPEESISEIESEEDIPLDEQPGEVIPADDINDIEETPFDDVDEDAEEVEIPIEHHVNEVLTDSEPLEDTIDTVDASVIDHPDFSFEQPSDDELPPELITGETISHEIEPEIQLETQTDAQETKQELGSSQIADEKGTGVQPSQQRTLYQKVMRKIFPPFVPRYPIEERLIANEHKVDESMTYHLSELQLGFGILLGVLGLILSLFYFYPGLSVLLTAGLLILTGFEVEEIIITNKRILIRKVGLVERVLRIPVDEEHLLKHVVSYYVGRAPVNIFLVFASILLILFAGLAQWIFDYNIFFLWIAVYSSLFSLGIGLRLWKRALTINFTGGTQLVLGLRKGIPFHILANFSNMVLNVLARETRHD